MMSDLPAEKPKKGGPRPGSGRPEFIPTKHDRETALELAGLLVPHKTIAKIIGIDDKTLRRHMAEELAHGIELVSARIKSNIYAHARKGSIRANCYLADRMHLWPAPPE